MLCQHLAEPDVVRSEALEHKRNALGLDTAPANHASVGHADAGLVGVRGVGGDIVPEPAEAMNLAVVPDQRRIDVVYGRDHVDLCSACQDAEARLRRLVSQAGTIDVVQDQVPGAVEKAAIGKDADRTPNR